MENLIATRPAKEPYVAGYLVSGLKNHEGSARFNVAPDKTENGVDTFIVPNLPHNRTVLQNKGLKISEGPDVTSSARTPAAKLEKKPSTSEKTGSAKNLKGKAASGGKAKKAKGASGKIGAAAGDGH